MKKLKKFLQLRKLLVTVRMQSINAGCEKKFNKAYHLCMRFDKLEAIAKRQRFYAIWKFCA